MAAPGLAGKTDAGVGDQAVQAAELLLGAAHRLLAGRVVGNVQRQHDNGAAMGLTQFTSQLLQAVFPARGQGQIVALARELASQGLADTGAGAGQQVASGLGHGWIPFTGGRS